MIESKVLRESGFFSEKILKKGEILFREGDIDNTLYYIHSGKVVIEKSRKLETGKFKILGVLTQGNIIGEGSLTQKHPKKVQITAVEDTLFYCIDSGNFKDFYTQKSDIAYDFLLEIIKIGNERVINANYEITSSFEVAELIANMGKINTQNINTLLEEFNRLLQGEYILYFEKVSGIPFYYRLKYHSGSSPKTQNILCNIPEKLSIGLIKEFKISLQKHSIITSLELGIENQGFLVSSRNTSPYSLPEKKLLSNISRSFVGIIYQKQIQNDLMEQKNFKDQKEI